MRSGDGKCVFYAGQQISIGYEYEVQMLENEWCIHSWPHKRIEAGEAWCEQNSLVILEILLELEGLYN